MDKIFQPPTACPTGSSGWRTELGLSLSYDIVRAHGGELNLETKYVEALPAGQAGSAQAGSEFVISLPINDTK